MPKIDLKNAQSGSGSSYPVPFDEPCRSRSWHRLGVAAGLTHLGVNLVRLAPGAWSRQRHWHTHEDGGEYSDIDMAFRPGRYTGGGAAQTMGIALMTVPATAICSPA